MVNYSLAHMSTKPGVENAPKKYYAKAQANGEITMDEIAEDISYATSLTDGDVLNALRALIQDRSFDWRTSEPFRYSYARKVPKPKRNSPAPTSPALPSSSVPAGLSRRQPVRVMAG